MPIPPVSKFRVPLLKLLGDGKDHSLADAANALADTFNLTPEERASGIPSSGYPVVRHRTGWAGFHLRKAGIVQEGLHGVFRITPEGKALLAKNPTDLSERVLLEFPKYQAWRKAVLQTAGVTPAATVMEDEESASPEEIIANAYAKLRANLAAELLERVKAKPAAFFEQLVVDLLLGVCRTSSLKLLQIYSP